MTPTTTELHAIAGRIMRRQCAVHERAERRRTHAQCFAQQLAERMAGADPSLRCVIGFGSTFETWRRYRLDSDIDLGIRGGDIEKLMDVVANHDFEVSLVDLDAQPHDFSALVERNGVVLYAKQ